MGVNTTIFEVVGKVEGVLCKVPTISKRMEYVDEFTLENGIVIPIHYHFLMLIGKIVLNVNFYGFTEWDTGKKANCDVVVYKKTTPEGLSFTSVDILKSKLEKPLFNIKYVDVFDESEQYFQILNTNKNIVFRVVSERTEEDENILKEYLVN